MPNDDPYYFAFSQMLGIGPTLFLRLENEFKSIEDAYNADISKLEKLLGKSVAQKWHLFKSSFNPIAQLSTLSNKNIQFISKISPLYPKALRQITDPPIGIYLRGNPEIFTIYDHFFAIVGTRIPSSYGVQITTDFATGLCQYGFVIVSGMATGVDSVAHKAVVEAGKPTVAVLGCGIDTSFSDSKQKLYNDIIGTGGAVISEFPPAMHVQKGLFVARNRIISGICRGTLVIEGAAQSGTLITARYAALQGRDVFAPPVPLTSTLSQAPLLLLKQGAHLVTSVEDIVSEYAIPTENSTEKSVDFSNFGACEQKVIQALLEEQLTPDRLSERIRTPLVTVLGALTTLEIAGIISKQSDESYSVTIH